jgi:hypothetical protein
MHGRRMGFGLAAAVAALCAVAPATQADTNEGTVAGLTYMLDLGPRTAAPSVLSADAACPGSTHVVGGGTSVSGISGFTVQFWLNSTNAFDGPDPGRLPDDGWRGRAYNRFGSDKRIAVFAICSRDPVRYATGRRSVGPGSAALVRAACPSGTHVAGGGADLSGSATQAYLNWSVPYDSNDADSRPDDGWRARAYNQGGPAKTLTVRATCVAANPRYRVRASSNSGEAVGVDCPAGTHLMGGGGAIAGAADNSFLTAIEPVGDGSGPPDDALLVAVHRFDPSPDYLAAAVCKA